MSPLAPYAPLGVLREEPEGTVHVARAPDGRLVGVLEPRDDLPRLGPRISDAAIYGPVVLVGTADARRAVVDAEPTVRLSALLTEGPVPPAFAARVFLDALMGLARVHDLGERLTLRPDRVTVTAEGHARVVLLGAEDDTMLASSLRFTAPEELERVRDERGDLWSAGVLLWEMLTGKPLFSGHGWSLLVAIGEQPIPSVSAARPELAPLQPFLERLLARDPEARFGSAREAAAAWIDAASSADGIASRDAFAVLVQSRCEALFEAQEAALLSASRIPPAPSEPAAPRPESPPRFEDEVRTVMARIRRDPTSPSLELSLETSSPRSDPMLLWIAVLAFTLAFTLAALLRLAT